MRQPIALSWPLPVTLCFAEKVVENGLSLYGNSDCIQLRRSQTLPHLRSSSFKIIRLFNTSSMKCSRNYTHWWTQRKTEEINHLYSSPCFYSIVWERGTDRGNMGNFSPGLPRFLKWNRTLFGWSLQKHFRLKAIIERQRSYWTLANVGDDEIGWVADVQINREPETNKWLVYSTPLWPASKDRQSGGYYLEYHNGEAIQPS